MEAEFDSKSCPESQSSLNNDSLHKHGLPVVFIEALKHLEAQEIVIDPENISSIKTSDLKKRIVHFKEARATFRHLYFKNKVLRAPAAYFYSFLMMNSLGGTTDVVEGRKLYNKYCFKANDFFSDWIEDKKAKNEEITVNFDQESGEIKVLHKNLPGELPEDLKVIFGFFIFALGDITLGRALNSTNCSNVESIKAEVLFKISANSFGNSFASMKLGQLFKARAEACSQSTQNQQMSSLSAKYSLISCEKLNCIAGVDLAAFYKRNSSKKNEETQRIANNLLQNSISMEYSPAAAFLAEITDPDNSLSSPSLFSAQQPANPAPNHDELIQQSNNLLLDSISKGGAKFCDRIGASFFYGERKTKRNLEKALHFFRLGSLRMGDSTCSEYTQRIIWNCAVSEANWEGSSIKSKQDMSDVECDYSIHESINNEEKDLCLMELERTQRMQTTAIACSAARTSVSNSLLNIRLHSLGARVIDKLLEDGMLSQDGGDASLFMEFS